MRGLGLLDFNVPLNTQKYIFNINFCQYIKYNINNIIIISIIVMLSNLTIYSKTQLLKMTLKIIVDLISLLGGHYSYYNDAHC